MLKLFKDLYIGYFATAFVGACALVFWALYDESNPYALNIILFAVLFIVADATFFVFKANKRYTSILNLMLNDCSINKYLDKINALLKNRRLKGRVAEQINLNRAAAHINLGDTKTALAIVNQINRAPFAKKKHTALNFDFTVASNRASAYLLENELDKAEACIASMNDILQSPDFPQNIKVNLYTAYDSIFARLTALKGDYENARQLLVTSLERNSAKLYRVRTNYYLGIVYSVIEPQEAQAAFEFAAENGGDSIYAKLAKEKLSTL